MGKERLPTPAQRISSSTRGKGRGNTGGAGSGVEGAAAAVTIPTIQGAAGRGRGRRVVVDVGEESEGQTRDAVAGAEADATGWLEPLSISTATTTITNGAATTNTNTATRATSIRIRTRTASIPADTRGVKEEKEGAGQVLLEEGGRGSTFQESWTIERDLHQEDKTGREQFDTSAPAPATAQILTPSHQPSQAPNPQPQTPLPRQSPDPHPQPQRFVLKFDRRVLEKSQAKQREQRKLIEGLLERQREEALCVSELVRERDLEIMPSLEGALGLRSGRARAGGAIGGGVGVNGNGVSGEKEREGRARRDRDREGRVVNGTGERDGKINGTHGVQKVVRNGRRARDNKENQLNGIGNANGHGNGVHEGDVPLPGLNMTTSKPLEPSKPLKPKKMELELRIDDKSKDKDKETLERNIDNVIFGEVTFKAWYPSWYPKEIIGEKALAGDKGGIVVNELYVCQRCFGYGKVLVEWVRHCRCCERDVPGQKVYVHGGWREDDSPRPTSGEWSIWEVDGGVETIFCQNLSLFAKLFLDNKSVFFDVSGFNYFLLVYTPPANSPHHNNTSSAPHKQIIGFFSKEKLSWDNNNLACILIFPPWQRKSLGALLMGVSYAIARREQILGGPEKPISELGRKGYKRFWGAEIARWILERPDRKLKGKKGRGKREEVSIKALSEETWIAQEDCLVVLRDMGVVERIGGRGRVSAGSAGEGEGNEVVKVRIDKEAVRGWCERERIKLERVVGEEGFRPGYAERVEDEEEAEEEEGAEEGEVDEDGDEEMGG